MLQMHITQPSLNSLNVNIGEAIKHLQRPQEGLKAAADNVKKFARYETFSSQGAAIGMPWKSGPKYNRLVQTGAMRNSFTSKASNQEGEISNSDWKFAFHQTKNKRIKASPRTMLAWAPRNIEVARRALQGYIAKIRWGR